MKLNALTRTWIIAEIGVNHEGDESKAADMVRKAAEAGADAVKFQTYVVEDYITAEQPERRQAVGARALSFDAFRRLAELARECGVTFFSTPLDYGSVDFLDEIAPLYKIASGDITALSLIRRVATKGKPVILSTGMASRDEIAAAIAAVLAEQPQAAENGHLALMHCTTAYPTPPEEAHLRNIGWLAREFGLPVGYSDHTLGIKACELAVAAGAVMLEKHFTYRKEDQSFHDHMVSADPRDMMDLVASVRRAEILLGSSERALRVPEKALLEPARRSLAAAVDIPAGVAIRAEWLTVMRPAWGLPPDRPEQVIGRTLVKARAKGEILRAEDLA